MKKSIRLLFAGLLAASSFSLAIALDLPVKRVNGHDYYYHEVERGETLLSIAEKLGVSREDIIRYNPAAADGLRPGTNLYLPVEKFSEADESKAGRSADGSALRYKVQRGETLYGIAYRFGITPEQIVALNPKADAGVKAGEILLLPSDGSEMAAVAPAASASSSASSIVPPAGSQAARDMELQKADYTTVNDEGELLNRRLPPVNSPTAMEMPAQTDADDELPDRRLRPVESPTAFVPAEIDTPLVAVLVPLDAEGDDEKDKHERNALDFVRGFMLGLESRSEDAMPVDVRVLDTRGSSNGIYSVLSQPGLAAADIVIAPDEPQGLSATLAADRNKEGFVMNLFMAQDTSYLTDARSIQTYIPSAIMYEKATEALLDEYGDYTPVFLIAKGGRSEKLPFTDYLRSIYAKADVEVMDMMFDGILTSDDLSELSREGKYIFIPASGAHSEFTKFARALVGLKSEFADPAGVALFGYPDWTAFIDESLDNLHALNAMVYTRFFNNTASAESRDFVKEFEEAYGVKPIEQIPSQAMLGYDAARYLLTNLRDNADVFFPEDGKVFRGVQSTFMFQPADEEDTTDDVRTTGPVNQALYIVTYRPGGTVSVDVI